MNEAGSRLACFELWGGNHKAVHPIELPGLTGWVHSEPFEVGAGGGDVHYFSVCSKGMVSRIVLADVAGHGQSASSVAERLRRTLQRHSDSWDQSILVRELNEAFLADSVGVQYATAAVLGFYIETGELLFTNAGHPPALWYRAREQSWSLLQDQTPYAVEVEGLPLGIISGTSYSQTAVQLRPKDILVLYTDGVTETLDEAGNELGQNGLLKLTQVLPTQSPVEAGQALLDGVQAFRGREPHRDDETLIVLQHERSLSGF